MKTLFMETTSIPAEQTAGEMTSILIQTGARQIAMGYDPDGNITEMHFDLIVNGRMYPFRLPVRVEPVFKILNGRRRSSYERSSNAAKDRQQARRVAWRQLYRWVQAQFAMINADMASAREVYLPYLVDQDGRTLFDAFEENRFKALPPGTEPLKEAV